MNQDPAILKNKHENKHAIGSDSSWIGADEPSHLLPMEIMMPLIRWFIACIALVGWSLSAVALEPTTAVKVTPLLKTTTSWNGKPLTYPTGQAEVTALLVEIAPGGETGWHTHAIPSFGYLLQGELEVTLKDGQVRRMHPGDALAEVVDTWHNGHSVGSEPVKIVVFYAGVTGQELSHKAP